MSNLVFVKRNDVFTDSLVIAKESENQHDSVVKQIIVHREKFEKMGGLKTTDLRSGVRGPATTVYLLNEPQASFIITLLRNTESVVDFKYNLVNEFYRMRLILMERRSTDWLQTREKGKLIRREETDAIQLLIPYAEEQGSKNANKFYTNYSKIVNKAVGLESGQRETAPHKTLMLVALMEDIISHTIIEEIDKGTYYKNIYQICKKKIESFVSLAYLQVS